MSLLAGPVLALAGSWPSRACRRSRPDAAAEAMRAAGSRVGGRPACSAAACSAWSRSPPRVAALVGNAATAAVLTVVFAALALFSWRLLVRTGATAVRLLRPGRGACHPVARGAQHRRGPGLRRGDRVAHR